MRKIYPGSCVDVHGASVLGAVNFILLPGMSVGKDDNILFTTRQEIIKSAQGAFEQAKGLTGTKLLNDKINKKIKQTRRLGSVYLSVDTQRVCELFVY